MNWWILTIDIFKHEQNKQGNKGKTNKNYIGPK